MMANENNKPYFLLVVEKGNTIPTIVSTNVIADIFPCADKKWLILQPRAEILLASRM